MCGRKMEIRKAKRRQMQKKANSSPPPSGGKYHAEREELEWKLAGLKNEKFLLEIIPKIVTLNYQRNTFCVLNIFFHNLNVQRLAKVFLSC